MRRVGVRHPCPVPIITKMKLESDIDGALDGLEDLLRKRMNAIMHTHNSHSQYIGDIIRTLDHYFGGSEVSKEQWDRYYKLCALNSCNAAEIWYAMEKARTQIDPDSSNGRTGGFEPPNDGSIPSSGTKTSKAKKLAVASPNDPLGFGLKK